MKKLIVTISLAAFATGAIAQGLIAGANTATTDFLTNSVAIGGTSGNAVAAQLGGNFYYELLVNQSTVTTVNSSLQNLLAAGWSDTQYAGTNSTTLISGRVHSGQTVANNWPFYTFESFMLIGWTAPEAGGGTGGFNTLFSELNGAQFHG